MCFDFPSPEHSTKVIADFIRTDEVALRRCRDIAVLYKYPQSLIFYGRDLNLNLIRIDTPEEMLQKAPPCALVLSRDYEKIITRSDKKFAQIIAQFPSWYLVDFSR